MITFRWIFGGTAKHMCISGRISQESLKIGVAHVCPIGDSAVLFLVVILIIQGPSHRYAFKLRCLNEYGNTITLGAYSVSTKKNKNSDSGPLTQFPYIVIRA